MWSRTKGAARTAALAVLAMSIFWTATQLHAEPLLACVLAGIITINRQCGPRSLRLVYLQSLLSPHACSGFWLLTVVFQQAQNGVAILSVVPHQLCRQRLMENPLRVSNKL